MPFYPKNQYFYLLISQRLPGDQRSEDLYNKVWIPYIKETFNGFGNAIDYLGRYTHRIAISNNRIKIVTDSHVTFAAKDYKTGENKDVTLPSREFIRRFLMHVLPSGFQKIRYYGFLNNRSKKINLKIIVKLTGKALFQSKFINMSHEELLKSLWNINIQLCTECGCCSMKHAGRTYSLRNQIIKTKYFFKSPNRGFIVIQKTLYLQP